MSERLVVGCMSGTSCDAVDAAAVRVSGTGLGVRIGLAGIGSKTLGDAGEQLRALSHGRKATTRELTTLRAELFRCHAAAINAALDAIHTRSSFPDLVVCHGQTMFHSPPLSWQMFDPSPLARWFGCPVVSDLRAADLAAGGEGAPITPIADWVLYRGPSPRTIVNLGGFCNVTVLPEETASPDLIDARDVCPCNQLLDAASRRLLGEPFDVGGLCALKGVADEHASKRLAEAIDVRFQNRASLGSGDEAAELLDGLGVHPGAPNALATLCDALARVIVGTVPPRAPIALAGGGARNGALVRAIERHATGPVRQSIEGDTTLVVREAVAMAVLGVLCQDGVPITLRRVTGGNDPAPVAGLWTLPPDGSWEVRPRG